MARQARKSSNSILNLPFWILAAAGLCFVVIIRIHLLDAPLERDEGEYAYTGQLILDGVPPFALAYSMKLPGVALVYALGMSIFGQTITAIHITLLLVNVASAAVIFLLARQTFGTITALVAAVTYAFLSSSSAVLGFAAHSEQFVILPVLVGAVILLRSKLSNIFVFLSGVCFGLGFLMKQPAAIFVGFGIICLIRRDRLAKSGGGPILLRSCLFLLGSVLPCLIVSTWIWRAGQFHNFWFWTVVYPREYNRSVSFSESFGALRDTFQEIFALQWPFWIVAIAGLILIWVDKLLRQSLFFILSFCLAAILAVSGGLHFRNHYFIFLLPAVSLLCGTTLQSLAGKTFPRHLMVRLLGPALLLLMLAITIFADRRVFFAPKATDVTKFLYGSNPFVEAIPIANYLREHTTATDRIAVLGSEPEIYFYAHRHSATGYIYMYELLSPHRFAGEMQRQLISETEHNAPKYLVYTSIGDSWGMRPDSDKSIFDWLTAYSDTAFRMDGLINIFTTRSDYYLPLEIDPKKIHLSMNYLLIFERKQD